MPKNSIKTLVILCLCLCIGLMIHPYAGAKKCKAKYCFKLASLAPKSIGWAKHIREIIHPALKKATSGNVELNWFWGGLMGNDKDYIQKMKIGQLHGAAFSGQGVVLLCPEMAVLELPFMFNDYREVDYIRKKMISTFDRYVEKRGYKLIVWADQDFDQIYSVKFKMDRLEDFNKARFLTWYGPMEHKLLTTLGSSPVPVNVTEVSPSILQGVGDALIAPAIWVIGSQLYGKFKYVNPIQIRYSPTAVFVTMEAWNSIPQNYRNNIMTIRNKEAYEFLKRTREDSKKSFDAMVKYGIKVSEMKPEELNRIREESMKIWMEMADKDFPKELLDELLLHLRQYRAGLK
ncbi:MAG: TRAP transporter substrate-binding protein DctP [Deltaproteobacteria bacterium]|nr:TRAP transporter substrate-binding protein DctP [Deltaproteobacteria bacterium]MBW2180032.1 TRAP transporter substrate-binding protein DctP [Deltaproteobacteria bacterium]